MPATLVPPVLPSGRHRPQNGLRVADEQDLMTANEERDRKTTAAAICSLSFFAAR